MQIIAEDIEEVELKNFEHKYGNLYDINLKVKNNLNKRCNIELIPRVLYKDSRVDVEVGIDQLNIIRKNGTKERLSANEYLFDKISTTHLRAYNDSTGNVGSVSSSLKNVE